jgi:2-phospho-L-lactate transferase/gluconeogenesis factor (CofD/UPF0052 family)
MTQPGETDNFNVTDHLRVLFEYSPNLLLDYVVVNSQPISDELKRKYLDDGAAQVEFDSTLLPDFADSFQSSISAVGGQVGGFQLICSDLLLEDHLVRHDPDKLGRLVLEIHQMARLAVG